MVSVSVSSSSWIVSLSGFDCCMFLHLMVVASCSVVVSCCNYSLGMFCVSDLRWHF